MLLVVTHSRAARRDLRNVCRAHDSCIVWRFGRAALLCATEFGAFQALRLQAKHGVDVQLERVRPFEPTDAPDHVRTAARRYEDRSEPAVPYARFASGRELPSPSSMREEPL